MLLSPQCAAELLLERRRARASMVDYVRYLDLGFAPAAHHRLMCDKLDAVERGEITKLALFLPPGSAKSTYANQLFCAYYLGKNPTKSIITCSHTQDLVDRFGRRTRNLFASPEHTALFDVSLARDSQAVSHWSTDKDGEYYAAGVGVAISGRRADLGVIDDPVRNREDADSATSQAKKWDWYVSDFLPRLKPSAAQILIMTRWHERDLGGRILEREGAQWTIVELPMEARADDDVLGRKLGDRLWPDWFTDEMVATAKLDTRSWTAEYQQRPVADEGDYFKYDWFADYERIPDNAHYYGASDFAVTEGHGDFTEHGIFALDAFGNVYIADWWRGQTTSDIWIERKCDLIQKYQPLIWFGESGPIRRAVEPYLALRMTERSAMCRIEWLPSIADKPTRCRNFQALASMGKVFLPRVAPWKPELLTQLTHFPAGRHDDGVDVCSLLGRGLDQVAAPRMKKWTQTSTATSSDTGELAWLAS